MLIKGADWLVTGASALAARYKVSDLVIGLTIVSFGTSAPELVVNSVASLQHHSDIVYGNIIGSNIANLFLILGAAGIIYPISVQTSTVWKEIPISLLAVIALYLFSNSFISQGPEILTRFEGFILLAMFGGFMYYVYKQMRSEKYLNVEIDHQPMPDIKIWSFIIFGLAGLILGGKLVVDYAVKIATELGISEKIIGLTIIAVGTSLPELMTSVVAAFKKNSGIALGNVIGSNIFNILLVLAISSLIHPVEFNTSFNIEIYLLVAGTLFLFIAMFTGGKKKLDRWEAALLLIVYFVYMSLLIANEI